MLTKQTTVSDLMRSSGVAFGTSGARGLATAMTDQVCHGYTTGFLKCLTNAGAWTAGRRVALAGDLRPSTPRILVACAQAIRDLGGEPVFCGFVPTPALALWAFSENIPAIMVTGSHIPDDRNGIKFYRPDGEILKDDEPAIARQAVTAGSAEWTAGGMLANPRSLPAQVDITHAYASRYVEAFGDHALSGLKIGVYQHSAVGRDILAQILSLLGAEIVLLGRSETFVPVDTEAVRPEDIMLARQWAQEYGLDAIVSTDGDSDRPLLADHTGEWLRGDVLGVLCARALRATCVVTPVSSNTLVEKCKEFSEVRRTRIGSPYVIAAMNSASATTNGLVCGYEANGGFMLANDVDIGGKVLRALPTRDAVLPIVAVLSGSYPGRLHDQLETLPSRVTHSDRLQEFAPARRDALMSWLTDEGDRSSDSPPLAVFEAIAQAPLVTLDMTDGVRMVFANERIIHLRGSGNAPELRCYTEAESDSLAAKINRLVLQQIAHRFP